MRGNHSSRQIRTAPGVLLTLALLAAGLHGHVHAAMTTNFAGWTTNGPAVYRVYAVQAEYVYTNMMGMKVRTNEGKRVVQPVWGYLTNATWSTNLEFQQLREDSFNYRIWTNMTARTNGRDMRLWSVRSHPEKWPKDPPNLKWNRRSLLYGMQGFTALSPCWEAEPSPGQTPITALTRRHGYTRGHGMGDSGFGKRNAGKRVWFLTADDRVVTARIDEEVVRTGEKDHRDYTIFIFDRDLPQTITPLRVAARAEVEKIYPDLRGAPRPFLFVEQAGYASANLPGFTVSTYKGGDSGAPDLLPLGDALVFFGGRSTSGPSPEMQADMDELCRRNKLNPEKYRLQWAQLGAVK